MDDMTEYTRQIEEQRREMQEAHDAEVAIDDEITTAKGEPLPYDPFAKFTPEDQAARTQERLRRGEAVPLAPLNAEEIEQIDALEPPPQEEPQRKSSAPPVSEYVPPPFVPYEPREVPDDIEDLASYRDFLLEEMSRQQQHYSQQEAERAASGRVVNSEAWARQQYRDYDDMLDEWIIPALRHDPAARAWLFQQPNPAEVAYRYSREAARRYAAKTAGQASAPPSRRVSRGRLPKKMTAAEIDATPNDKFAAMLDQWHAEGQPD